MQRVREETVSRSKKTGSTQKVGSGKSRGVNRPITGKSMNTPHYKYGPEKTGRQLFLPKYRELAEQCASCPFKDGNDKEWG